MKKTTQKKGRKNQEKELTNSSRAVQWRISFLRVRRAPPLSDASLSEEDVALLLFPNNTIGTLNISHLCFTLR